MEITVGRLVLYVLCVASEVFGVLISPLPQNQAILRGTTVAFSCSSNPNGWSAVGWSFVPVGQTSQIFIANGGSVYDEVNYNVSSEGKLTSILVIRTVDESLAGTYLCTEGLVSASAQLIVYNSAPMCTSNASSMNYLSPGQVVQLSCTFNYVANFSFVSVNMDWSASGSLRSSESPKYSTSGIVTRAASTIYQAVSYSSPFPAYQCQTSFRVTGSNATNVPSYINTATIPEKDVIYFVPNCSIKGAKSGDSVYQGTNFSCEVDANPPPNYRWSNVANVTLSTNSTIQIWNDGLYLCSVWNDFGSCQVSISLTTYITTSTPTVQPYSSVKPTVMIGTEGRQTPASQQNKGVIVGVVVGIGGPLILALLIFLICYRIRKTQPGTKEERSTENEREVGQHPAMGQTKKPEQDGNENIGDYEMLTDRSTQLPPVYCQLRPIEHENSVANNFSQYDNIDQ